MAARSACGGKHTCSQVWQPRHRECTATAALSAAAALSLRVDAVRPAGRVFIFGWGTFTGIQSERQATSPVPHASAHQLTSSTGSKCEHAWQCTGWGMLELPWERS